MRSEKNKFTIGLGDILECLRFAEKEGEVPKLPVEWWGSEYGQTITQRENKGSVTVQILKKNIVNGESILNILQKIARKEWPL